MNEAWIEISQTKQERWNWAKNWRWSGKLNEWLLASQLLINNKILLFALRLASLRLSSTIESIKSKKFDLLMKLIEPRMKAISRKYYNSKTSFANLLMKLGFLGLVSCGFHCWICWIHFNCGMFWRNWAIEWISNNKFQLMK